MTPEEAVLALTAVAAAAGVEVRVEPFTHPLAGKGGLCRVETSSVLLVDARLGALEQAGVIGLALGALELDAALVPHELRSYLATGHAELVKPPRLKLRPLVRVK
ncbi:MAG: hypothetical protein JWP97_4044 [Labilithrix sp.]|nr:hypothetical protein [Labilithrix sp.]